jgi:hypothetical protein
MKRQTKYTLPETGDIKTLRTISVSVSVHTAAAAFAAAHKAPISYVYECALKEYLSARA